MIKDINLNHLNFCYQSERQENNSWKSLNVQNKIKMVSNTLIWLIILI
jgi:hypothetical protein